MSSAPEPTPSESAKTTVNAKTKRKKVLAWIGGALVTPVIVGLGIAYMADAFGPSSTPASAEGPGAGTGPPLTAVVSYGNEASSSPCGYWGLDWVFAGGPSQLPTVSGMKTRDSLINFAAAHHAVPTYGSNITLTIQAHAAHSVVLTGMQVIVVQRRPAVEGVYMVSGGCGGITPRWFLIDSLDADQPQVTAQDGQNQGQTIPAISFPFTVSESDPEVFMVSPNASSHEVDWKLELDWIADGKPGKTVIDDSGKPFQFTASSAAKPYEYSGDKGWTPVATQGNG